MKATPASLARAVGRWVARLTLLVAVLLGGAALLVQVDTVAALVIRATVGLALPAGTSVSLARAEIAPFREIRIDSLAIRRATGDTAVAATRVELRIRPTALLRRRIEIERLRLDQPRVSLARGADSSWSLFEPSTPASPSESSTAWLIAIGRLRIDDGAVRATLGGDSVHRATELTLRASDIRLGAANRGRLDSLSANLTMAGHADHRGSLRASGRWDAERLVIDTLDVVTDRSRIVGAGTIPLAPPFAGEPRRFRLLADPLALDELTDFVPAIGGPPVELTLEGDEAPGGRLSVTGSVRWPDGASVTLHGRVGDSAGVPLLGSIRATLERFDPGAVLTSADFDGAIDAHLSLDLAGEALQAASGEARLTIEPSRLQSVEGLAGTVTARATEGQVEIRAELATERLELTASGQLDPTGEEVAYSLEGRVQGEPLAGGVIHFNGGGHGLPPNASIRLAARSDSVRVGDSVAVAAQLQARLDADSLLLALNASTAAGSLQTRLVGHPFEDAKTFVVRQGRIERLDLGTFADAVPSTELSGRLQGSLRLGDRQGGRLVLTLDSSRIGHGTLEHGQVTAVLDDEALSISSDLQLDNGGIELDAEARPFDTPITYRISRGRTRDLDLGALLEREGWRSSVTGSFTLHGSGSDSTNRQLDAELELEPSSLADLAVDSARVRASLIGDSVSIRGTASVEGGRLNLSGGGRLADSLLASRGSAMVGLQDVAWREVTIDSGAARLELAGGTVVVDTLWVRSNVLALTGGGGVALSEGAAPDSLHLDAELADIAPIAASFELAEMTAGHGTATATLVGPAQRLRLDGRARVAALRYGSARLVGIEATAEAHGSLSDGVDAGLARIVLDRLVLPTATVERTEATVRLAPSQDLVLEAESRVDEARTISLDARLDPSAAERVWTIERADASITGTSWSLTAPAHLHSDGILSLDRLVLAAPGRTIELRGVLDSAGTRNFRVAVDSFPVETVADLIGYDAVRGSLTGTLELAGNRSAPAGRLALGFATVDRHGNPARLELDGRLRGPALTLDGSVTRGDRVTGRVEGEVPWPLSREEGPLALAIDADSLQLVLLEPFVDPTLARGIDGRVSGHVEVSGSPGEPQLDGALRLMDGRVQLPALGVTWERADLVAELARNTIELRRGTITSGGGTVQARGEIELSRLSLGQLDLDLTADDFRAIHSDVYHAVVSGAVEVVGTTRAPTIRGTIDVLHGDVFLGDDIRSEDIEEVSLTEEDYQQLEAYFGFPVRHPSERMIPTLEELTLDLTARLGRDSWLRQDANPKLAVQLDGELQIKKQPGPAMQLLGTLTTIPERSYVTQFGRRFDLREGRLTFRGDRLDTRIDLQAAYTVPSRTDPEPEAVIVLGIEGTVGDLDLVLSSEPAMSNGDIVSYLATGRPAGQALAVGGGQSDRGLAATGTDLALDQAANALEGLAADKVGLDVIEIERDGLDGATLVAGRYVSPSLYLGFKQPIEFTGQTKGGSGREPRTQIELELQAYRWLLLNFQSGGDLFQFFLRARHGY